MTSGNLKGQGLGRLLPFAPISSIMDRWLIHARDQMQKLATHVDRWKRGRMTWNTLQGMDDRSLSDIGLSRADVWEDPRDRVTSY